MFYIKFPSLENIIKTKNQTDIWYILTVAVSQVELYVMRVLLESLLVTLQSSLNVVQAFEEKCIEYN